MVLGEHIGVSEGDWRWRVNRCELELDVVDGVFEAQLKERAEREDRQRREEDRDDDLLGAVAPSHGGFERLILVSFVNGVGLHGARHRGGGLRWLSLKPLRA